MSVDTSWSDEDEDDVAIGRGRARRRAAVSLTPLVDVVFILLVFFMLATSFVDWRLIDMQSRGAASGAGSNNDAVTLDVAPTELLLAGASADLAGLRTELSARLREKPSLQIIVRPKNGADMQRLVDVLDVLEASGAQRVALQATR